ncbi:adhesive plaque matrix protein [Daphnia magna]|uniref:adhesive plaque matrix protein n=1 Tax=Daphnia magna TaxID=35525 RepID=UPI001E1BD70E|nr:adhesive plaque matrix protein [Daphnia magna]
MKIFLFAALLAVAAAGGAYRKDPYAKDGYQSMNYGQGYKKDNKQDYSMDYNQNKKGYSTPDYYQVPTPYDFAYKVTDEASYNDFGHQESGDGYGNVKGSYFVYLPDGTTQTVNYKADSYGYVADVQYTGEPKYGDNYAPAPYKGAPSYPRPTPSYKAVPSYPPPTPSYKAAPSYPPPTPSYKPQYPPTYPTTPYMMDKYPAPSTYPMPPNKNIYEKTKRY